jgi:GNAT superfamily N-acetyltransferase
MLGLDHRFHGQPANQKYRYSNQIVSHLRFEAMRLLEAHREVGRNTLPLLALYVHRENQRAIRLYEKFGFVVEPSAARGSLLFMIQKLSITSE